MVTYAKISPKMVNPRDAAEEVEEGEKENTHFACCWAVKQLSEEEKVLAGVDKDGDQSVVLSMSTGGTITLLNMSTSKTTK